MPGGQRSRQVSGSAPEAGQQILQAGEEMSEGSHRVQAALEEAEVHAAGEHMHPLLEGEDDAFLFSE
jgi:hypothetical protein